MSEEYSLDEHLIHRRFARAAGTRIVDVLSREIAARMAERLDLVRLQPTRILDLGCGRGEDLRLLRKRYPQAALLGVDVAMPMLARTRRSTPLLDRLRRRSPRLIAAQATALPLASGSVTMLWSNLLLPWVSDPLPVLREMQRVLAVDGMLMFATLGPDTLMELRRALPSAQGERVHRFIDMHDIGDALVTAGFTQPVMDMDRITLTYRDLDALLADLRQTGCTNAASTRPRGLSGKAGWAEARTRYEAMRSDGRLPATFEIVFGHAWKPEPRTTAEGEAIVRFHPRGAR